MVVIRKYGNRRLYDTGSSRYVNLADVAALVRAGEDVRVVDAKTDEDLTREVLLQVILDAQGGLDFLPVGLLRRIIRATGDEPHNRLLRQQLATAFDLLHGQLDRVEGQFATMFPAFFGGKGGARPASPAAGRAAEPPPDPAADAADAPSDAPSGGGRGAADEDAGPPPAKGAPAGKGPPRPRGGSGGGPGGGSAGSGGGSGDAGGADGGDDLAALRARLEQLEKRLKR